MMLLETEVLSTGGEDVRQYLSEIRRYPVLSPQQERELAMGCAAGDAEAIRTMVSSNLRLVVSIANRDYPVVQAIVVILAFWVVLAGTVADLVNARIDPRLQLGGDA